MGIAFDEWENLGSPGGGAREPCAVSWAPNRLDAFVLAADQHIYHIWREGGISSATWGKWETIEAMVSSPHLLRNFRSGLSAVSWGPNRLDIFGLGDHQDMLHYWYDGKAGKAGS